MDVTFIETSPWVQCWRSTPLERLLRPVLATAPLYYRNSGSLWLPGPAHAKGCPGWAKFSRPVAFFICGIAQSGRQPHLGVSRPGSRRVLPILKGKRGGRYDSIFSLMNEVRPLGEAGPRCAARPPREKMRPSLV